jgi:endo-1,4-beta-mannosidase
MSGALFVPTALYGENFVSSPIAKYFEQLFIKGFIERFRERECIIAWDLGNECNNNAAVKNRWEVANWIATITNAIRAADPTRPIYSGMHFTRINNDWNAEMLALYTDMQTTHPYPAYTDYCDSEGLNEMRASLHAAAESVYVADISNQPCLVEEIGSLSPITLSDDYLPEYIEKSLFSSFQYNTTGYLWWCAFEQDKLDFPPYDCNQLERNLGLAYADYTAKPVLNKMKKMSDVVKELGVLPTPKADAVCVLTFAVDQWKRTCGKSLSRCLAVQML